MALTLDRILSFFHLADGKAHRPVQRLDLARLSARDIADINLPPEVESRLLGQRQRGTIGRWNYGRWN